MNDGLKYFAIPLILFFIGMVVGWWMMARGFNNSLQKAGIRLVYHHIAASNWVEAVSIEKGGAK